MMPSTHPQAVKLRSLIRAASHASRAADRGLLFASPSGLRLVNAAFDLFECDALYDLADSVADAFAADRDGWPLDEDGERKRDPASRS